MLRLLASLCQPIRARRPARESEGGTEKERERERETERERGGGGGREAERGRGTHVTSLVLLLRALKAGAN